MAGAWEETENAEDILDWVIVMEIGAASEADGLIRVWLEPGIKVVHDLAHWLGKDPSQMTVCSEGRS